MAFRNPFSFLFQRSSAEERVAAYVIREHDRGRDLAEILEDRYVQNRLNPGAARAAARPAGGHQGDRQRHDRRTPARRIGTS